MIFIFHHFQYVHLLMSILQIYPSEYGLKRLAEEDVKGPIELVEKREDDDKFDGDGKL